MKVEGTECVEGKFISFGYFCAIFSPILQLNEHGSFECCGEKLTRVILVILAVRVMLSSSDSAI